MIKNQNKFANTTYAQWKRIFAVALIMMMFMSVLTLTGVMPALATVNTQGLDTVMTTVLTIIQTAAKYIGAVIILWGVFQIILAFRREDSEGISKQITTVVVGGILLGFGLTATTIYNAIKG